MLRRSPTILAVLAGASAACGQVARYDGERVVRAHVRSAQDLRLVLALSNDVWSHHVGVGGDVDIRVRPEQLAALMVSGVPVRVLIDDVQRLVDREAAQLARPKEGGAADGPGWFTTYHPYDEVKAYAQGFAPALSSFQNIGQSIARKDIFSVRVTGPGSTESRPQVLFIGGQHAREWVSVSTVMYLADQLIARYGSDPRIKALVDNIEFVFVPIVNPDGYAYTWSSDRLWRKNRRDYGSGCIGVDLNRNWGYQWGGVGASSDPCSDIYWGAAAFSEPETQVIRDYSNALPRLKTAIDFHSYSQLVMSPWGYTNALPPQPDASFFNTLTTTMRNAAQSVYGVQYTPGPVYTTVYPASGIAVDWWYGARQIYGLSIELRDTGVNGFLLPPEQIIPTGEENLAAVMALADFFMPVRFALTAPVPPLLTPNQATTVQVTITPGTNASVAPGSQVIYTRIGNSGPFVSVPLTLVSGTTFEGTLPGAPCGSQVQFYFEAAAVGGPTLQYPSAAAPLATWAFDRSPVFSDDMEVDRGWTVTNGPALTSGAWERADPVSTFNLNGQMANPENDHTPAPGVNCYATQNGAVGAAAGLSDVDGGPTILTSPAINLAGASRAVMEYARWVYSVNGATDLLYVELSADDGANWVTASQVPTTNGWQVATLELSQFIPLTATVRVRFSISDEPNDGLTEAAIDDVVVSRLVCPACYANCDSSSVPPVLNANDFGCFLNAFAAGMSYANCDGSTAAPVLNANDFVCFLNQFAAGCP